MISVWWTQITCIITIDVIINIIIKSDHNFICCWILCPCILMIMTILLGISDKLFFSRIVLVMLTFAPKSCSIKNTVLWQNDDVYVRSLTPWSMITSIWPLFQTICLLFYCAFSSLCASCEIIHEKNCLSHWNNQWDWNNLLLFQELYHLDLDLFQFSLMREVCSEVVYPSCIAGEHNL